MEINDVTGAIVDAGIKLHTALGPGLLESVYEVLLARALERRGFDVKRQVPVPLDYDGEHFDVAFRIDLLVNDLVVVELKSVEKLAPVHWRQVLTYLRLMNLPIGLLMNFNAPRLTQGLHRILNDHTPPLSVSLCE